MAHYRLYISPSVPAKSIFILIPNFFKARFNIITHLCLDLCIQNLSTTFYCHFTRQGSQCPVTWSLFHTKCNVFITEPTGSRVLNTEQFTGLYVSPPCRVRLKGIHGTVCSELKQVLKPFMQTQSGLILKAGHG